MRILTAPKVYLVGKTQVELDGFKAFLKDQELNWPTPNSFGYYDIESVDPYDHLDADQQSIKSEIGSTFDADVPENQTLIEMFGRSCYMSFGAKAGSKTNADYLTNLIGLNREGPAHGSVTEHINFNFMIVGCGRGFSHEQVRHRTGWAYSQLSTRYCDFEREEEEGTWDPGFCIPAMAQLEHETQVYFKRALEDAVTNYTKLYGMISEDIEVHFSDKLKDMTDREKRTFVRKAARGAARDLLPIGTEAIMGMTGNVRAIYNCIYLRASREAEPQIRDVYVQIARIMEKEMPDIFKGLKYETNWDGTEYVVLPKDKL